MIRSQDISFVIITINRYISSPIDNIKESQ